MLQFIRKLAVPFKKSWHLFVLRGGIVGLQLLSVLLVAIGLGTEQFGLFTLLWSILLVSASVFSIGAPNFLLKELSEAKAAGPEIISLWRAFKLVVFFPSLVAAAGLALTFTITSFFYETSLLEYSFTIVLAALLKNIVDCLGTIVRVMFGPSPGMVVRDALPHLLILVSASIVLCTADKSVARIYEIYIFLLLTAIVLVSLTIYRLRPLPLRDTVPTSQRKPTVFWLNQMMGTASTNVDVVLAGMILPLQAVGIYSIAKRVANFVSFPQIVSNWLLAVDIGVAWASTNVDKIRNLAKLGVWVAVPPALAAGLLIMISSSKWLIVFDVLPTTSVLLTLAVLVLANIVNVSFGATAILAAQCGLERWNLFGRLSAVAFVILAMALLGASAKASTLLVAIVLAISIALSNGLIWLALKRHIKVDSSILVFFRKSSPPLQM